MEKIPQKLRIKKKRTRRALKPTASSNQVIGNNQSKNVANNLKPGSAEGKQPDVKLETKEEEQGMPKINLQQQQQIQFSPNMQLNFQKYQQSPCLSSLSFQTHPATTELPGELALGKRILNYQNKEALVGLRTGFYNPLSPQVPQVSLEMMKMASASAGVENSILKYHQIMLENARASGYQELMNNFQVSANTLPNIASYRDLIKPNWFSFPSNYQPGHKHS